MFKIFIFISLFVQVVLCQNYILTPKDHTLTTKSIAKEHSLTLLSEFNNGEFLSFYMTSHDNLMKYKNTLSKFYDIEEDVTITLSSCPFSNMDPKDIIDHSSFTSFTLPWHLNRVISRNVSNEQTFNYTQAGSCHTNADLDIHTYIIDTGIDITHPQFDGRAVWDKNTVDSDDIDCNGHGTHVAGLVGSLNYGVCVDAQLHAIKVLDCEGSGSLSGVIKGIEWAFKSHLSRVESKKSSKIVKGIINMSLGGGFSRAINKAVEYTLKNNEHFYIVVAAGNEDSNACSTSPASANGVLTVMASDTDDERAWFSNWGSCADIYAPGVGILSTIPNGKTAIYSGTSMASPVMVGVLNHYLDMYPDMNMKAITQQILTDASEDKILNNKKNTNNVLAYFNRTQH
jgi:cerevisin